MTIVGSREPQRQSHYGYKAKHWAKGAPTGGIIGPQTLAVAMAVDLVNLINRMAMYREQFYRPSNTFDILGKGWPRRKD